MICQQNPDEAGKFGLGVTTGHVTASYQAIPHVADEFIDFIHRMTSENPSARL